MRPNQSVLAPRNESILDGAYCVTAAANWAAFNTSGSRVTDETDPLVLYSTPVPWRPFAPFVVMSTTPLAALDP